MSILRRRVMLVAAVLWCAACSVSLSETDRLDVYSRALAVGPARITELEEVCTNGDAAACDAVGRFHEGGTGVPKSMAKAKFWFAKGCALDDAETCAEAKSLERRPMALRNDERACRSARDAARCYSAGEAYLHGVMVDPDPKRGQALLEAGCKATGKARSAPCTELGFALLGGVGGVARNPTRALPLLREQCDKRSGRACAYLAFATEQGLAGVKKDVRAAIDQYMPLCDIAKSALAGRPRGGRTHDAFACYRIATLAMRGHVRASVRGIAQLFAEACVSGTQVSKLACAPAAALFARHDLEYQPRFASKSTEKIGAVEMARMACSSGSPDGCAVLHWIFSRRDAQASAQ